MEVKDGAKPPSARRLTPDEKQWHERWQGQVVVVESVDGALRELAHGLQRGQREEKRDDERAEGCS